MSRKLISGTDLNQCANVIKTGGIIAYPTEAVYGLGCDPSNEAAVTRLFSIKKRPMNKGLILIASHWAQLAPYAKPLSNDQRLAAINTWPGAVTWLFPASTQAPTWLCGDSQKIAFRVTAHPLASDLCRVSDQAIVSTSANISGTAALKTAGEVATTFASKIDYLLEGELGGEASPSKIMDLETGRTVRE